MDDQHASAIGSLPIEFTLLRFCPHTTPEYSTIDTHPSQNLRQLCNMSEGIRYVADPHRITKLGSALQTKLQIADQRLTTHQKLVRLDIPGTNQNAPRARVLLEMLLLL